MYKRTEFTEIDIMEQTDDMCKKLCAAKSIDFGRDEFLTPMSLLNVGFSCWYTYGITNEKKPRPVWAQYRVMIGLFVSFGYTSIYNESDDTLDLEFFSTKFDSTRLSGWAQIPYHDKLLYKRVHVKRERAIYVFFDFIRLYIKKYNEECSFARALDCCKVDDISELHPDNKQIALRHIMWLGEKPEDLIPYTPKFDPFSETRSYEEFAGEVGECLSNVR